MTSLTIHSERRVSLIKAYLMVFKDLIKYARAIAEIARHWSENKSHIMQDLQIVFCLVILLMFFLQKKLKIRTKPTFPFCPISHFFSSRLPSSLNSYKKIHICMINKLHFFLYIHTYRGELGSCLAHSHAWPTSYNLNNYTRHSKTGPLTPTSPRSVMRLQHVQEMKQEPAWSRLTLVCIIILQKEGVHNPMH